MPDLKTEIAAKILTPPKSEPDEKARRTQSRMTSTPYYTVRLSQELRNEAEAARLIGMSSSGVGMGIKRGVISTTAEIAAKGVLAEMEAKKAGKIADANRDVVLLARVPADKKQALIVVAEAMGIQFKEV